MNIVHCKHLDGANLEARDPSIFCFSVNVEWVLYFILIGLGRVWRNKVSQKIGNPSKTAWHEDTLEAY